MPDSIELVSTRALEFAAEGFREDGGQEGVEIGRLIHVSLLGLRNNGYQESCAQNVLIDIITHLCS